MDARRMLQFDSDAARRIEAVYTTPDVIEQRRTVMELLALRPGERVLDVGVGPGLLAADMARAVGPGGAVSGIDISDQMLAVASGRAADLGPDSAPIEVRLGGADALPYPDGCFDVAVSTQVLEYVPDVPGALAEIRRVLRPGGRVLVLDTDWDSIVWYSTDAARMSRLLTTWEEHLVDPFLPRTLFVALRDAGFAPDPPVVVPLLNVGYRVDTYSGGMIDIIGAFVDGRHGWTAAAVKDWQDELRSLGDAYFFSLNRYVFCATKPT
jgi:arsenite methyltransferase